MSCLGDTQTNKFLSGRSHNKFFSFSGALSLILNTALTGYVNAYPKAPMSGPISGKPKPTNQQTNKQTKNWCPTSLSTSGFLKDKRRAKCLHSLTTDLWSLQNSYVVCPHKTTPC